MDRRDFIKNSLLIVGCSCLVGGGKFFYDSNFAYEFDNGIKLKKKYLVEEYKDKTELPSKVRLDACTLCQLNCPCCDRVKQPEAFKKACGLGYLSFKNFKKFVNNNDNIKEIELANNGEIFLNPELKDIVKYAYERNIKLTCATGTNLNYLTDEMAETLVKYKFDCLKVSIDGATPKTYAIYRRGGDFNQVINNIKKINYFKKKYNSIYPVLTYKFIVFGHNEHEIDQAKRLAKKLKMEVAFSVNHTISYSPVQNIDLVKKKTGIDTSLCMSEYLAQKYKKDYKNNKGWFICSTLWESPVINWDGRILGCCYNFYNAFSGNAFTDNLLSVLNSPQIIYAKNMLAGRAKPIKGIPCSSCLNYKLLQNMGLTIDPVGKKA